MTTAPEFIVLDETLSAPLSLVGRSSIWKDLPMEGILRRGNTGDPVHVFASRKLAKEAVERTQNYDAMRAAKGDDVHDLEMSISRLERGAEI